MWRWCDSVCNVRGMPRETTTTYAEGGKMNRATLCRVARRIGALALLAMGASGCRSDVDKLDDLRSEASLMQLSLLAAQHRHDSIADFYVDSLIRTGALTEEAREFDPDMKAGAVLSRIRPTPEPLAEAIRRRGAVEDSLEVLQRQIDQVGR